MVLLQIKINAPSSFSDEALPLTPLRELTKLPQNPLHPPTAPRFWRLWCLVLSPPPKKKHTSTLTTDNYHAIYSTFRHRMKIKTNNKSILLILYNKRVKGLDIYIPPLTLNHQQRFTMAYWPAMTLGGAAQVAAAHCPNERTLDPAVCSYNRPTHSPASRTMSPCSVSLHRKPPEFIS